MKNQNSKNHAHYDIWTAAVGQQQSILKVPYVNVAHFEAMQLRFISFLIIIYLLYLFLSDDMQHNSKY